MHKALPAPVCLPVSAAYAGAREPLQHPPTLQSPRPPSAKTQPISLNLDIYFHIPSLAVHFVVQCTVAQGSDTGRSEVMIFAMATDLKMYEFIDSAHKISQHQVSGAPEKRKKKPFSSVQTAIQPQRWREEETEGQKEGERDKNIYSREKICQSVPALSTKREREREGRSP